MTALSSAARRLLEATIRLPAGEVLDWCDAGNLVEAARELIRQGLAEGRRGPTGGRHEYRLTDAGLIEAMTPEPTSFRASQQAPEALRSGGNQ